MKLKLGKKGPSNDKRNLKLVKYMEPSLVPPDQVNWQNNCTYQMYLNDQLSDCTCAAVGNQIITWENNVNNNNILSNNDVLGLYELVGGYNPNDPTTDQGCVETDVLNYWTNSGVNGHKIGAYVQIDNTNLNQIKNAIAYMEGTYIGIQVPEGIPEDPGSVWDVIPNAEIEGGHAIILVGYDDNYLYTISWGAVYKMTYAFFTTYCDEAYALVSNDELNGNGVNAASLNINQLNNDLKIVKA